MDEIDEDFMEIIECAPSQIETLPHLRSQCLVRPFKSSSYRLHCVLCYCYVCDIPASECREWSTHCASTDAGPEKAKWKKMKEDKKARVNGGEPKKKKPKTITSYFQSVPVSCSSNNSSSNTSNSSSSNSSNSSNNSDENNPDPVNCASSSQSVPMSVTSINTVSAVPVALSASSSSSSSSNNNHNHSSSSSSSNSVAVLATSAFPPSWLECFPWASIEDSPAMYKGGVEEQPNKTAKRTYRRSHCVYCAVFKPSSKWSQPTYRDTARELFVSHEKSKVHIDATAAIGTVDVGQATAHIAEKKEEDVFDPFS